MTDYTPIDCGLHDEYEVIAMRQERVRLCWQDSATTTCDEIVRPLDMQTRHGEEFMSVRRSNGGILEIRLDRIRHLGPAG